MCIWQVRVYDHNGKHVPLLHLHIHQVLVLRRALIRVCLVRFLGVIYKLTFRLGGA